MRTGWWIAAVCLGTACQGEAEPVDLTEVYERIEALEAELAAAASELEATRVDLADAEDRLAAAEDRLDVQGTVVTTEDVEDSVAAALLDAGVLTTADLADYATTSSVESLLSGYATIAFVAGSGYATETWVGNQGFASQAWVGSQGFASQGDVTSALSPYATRSWVTGTALDGFATESWVTGTAINGLATESWVTGTAINGLATESWVTDTALSGLATESWVTDTALSGLATESWVTGTALAGLATESWVTQTALAGLATESWVTGTALHGLATESWVTDTALSGLATESWVTDTALADVSDQLAALDAQVPETLTSDLVLHVPEDFETLQEALDSLFGTAFAWDVDVTIQVADGDYDMADALWVGHPQGRQIHILGNQGSPSQVRLFFTGTHGLVVEGPGTTLGELDGFTLVGDGTATAAGVFVDGGVLRDLGPNLIIRNFGIGVDVTRQGFVDATGITMVDLTSTGGNATYGALADFSGATVTNAAIGFGAALNGITIAADTTVTTASNGYGATYEGVLVAPRARADDIVNYGFSASWAGFTQADQSFANESGNSYVTWGNGILMAQYSTSTASGSTSYVASTGAGLYAHETTADKGYSPAANSTISTSGGWIRP